MPDFDINAAAESIGKELFGEGGDGASTIVTEGENEGIESPPSLGRVEPSGSPSPLIEPDIPLPKAWKKEKEPLWKQLPKEAREYLTSREEDVVKGLSQYSSSHKNWSELVSPFEPVLKQYPDVNPVQLMQNLMRNHLAIVQSSPEQKRAIAANLLKSYGIDLGPSAAGAPLNSESPQTPPEIANLRNELQSVQRFLQEQQQAQYQSAVAEQARVVETFAKDPKNKHFDKVQEDIIRFIKTGAATDLASAYELACYANPEVRAAMIKDQQSAINPPPVSQKTLNIDGTAEGTPSRRKPRTIDDTIAEVIAKHNLTH